MVGPPEAAVKEARDRVRSAILNNQFDFPDRRITVNLAPADLPKQGAQFDLAIALGILVASDQLKGDDLDEYEFLGELSLSGDVRAGPGALPAMAIPRGIYLPNNFRPKIKPVRISNDSTWGVPRD